MQQARGSPAAAAPVMPSSSMQSAPPPSSMSPPAPRLPSLPSREVSELSGMTPLPAVPLKPTVPKGGRHTTAQGSVGGGGSRGGVLPAILGVGAAIGTIHFGAGVFPDMFKGADGRVDRTRLNVGGVLAGILVFLVSRYLYA
eukprot:jgi/Mesvir1/9620/Mv05582-RA.1